MLSMWVVYDHPSDHPDRVVVRESVVNASTGQVVLKPEAELFPTIEEARVSLRARGLGCVPRMPGDEPQIVEVWL